MFKRQMFWLMFFVLGVSLLGERIVSAADTRWYLTPGLSYIIADKDRDADNDLGFQLGIGKPLTETFNLELTVVGDALSQTTGSSEFEQIGVQLDGLHTFWRKNALSTYGVFGAGALQTDFNGEAHWEPMINLGVGAVYQLKAKCGTKLRSDIRYRIDQQGLLGEDKFGDWIVNIGFVLPIGKEKAADAPKPIVAPKPEIKVSVPVVVKDSDGDGVADAADACTETPAGVAVNAKGCELDGDQDGVVDRQDLCPGTPVGTPVNETGCTLKPKDSDGDGVSDTTDACPNTPAGVPVDAKGCELDSDQDGVVDRQDLCPATPVGTRVDAAGCKIPEVIVLKGVSFKSGSDHLTPDSTPVLDEAAETLRRNLGLVVEVAGYTDNVGKADSNKTLSQKRAETVAKYLVGKGVSADSLKAKGYGSENPIADNGTSDGKAKNRRVELHILSQ